ncbi:unnamed protein product [Soboliphyme baturini]|uniref:DUF4704 domain-containing protein n=1 Tax=Soboliphyme baturini TaxID=241478 RepID=A0A183J843_9BILA|nr:unnamed protein product [Soboliphyme baturini]
MMFPCFDDPTVKIITRPGLNRGHVVLARQTLTALVDKARPLMPINNLSRSLVILAVPSLFGKCIVFKQLAICDEKVLVYNSATGWEQHRDNVVQAVSEAVIEMCFLSKFIITEPSLRDSLSRFLGNLIVKSHRMEGNKQNLEQLMFLQSILPTFMNDRTQMDDFPIVASSPVNKQILLAHREVITKKAVAVWRMFYHTLGAALFKAFLQDLARQYSNKVLTFQGTISGIAQVC